MKKRVKKVNILITGCAGFIGFHLSQKILFNSEYNLIGIDNLNDYYDVNLKKNRLKILKKNELFNFYKIDINNKKRLENIFKKNKFNYVINLAAQAGVLHSVKFPEDYFNSNIKGFFNLIDLSKKFKIKHFIFASTSSVYGPAKTFPLKENHNTDKPLSFYAASKKCNEVIAHSYSNMYKLPCTALRFFTVYGPMGRPDMALFLFTEAIMKRKPIKLNNNGNHVRDFTHVDDIVEGIFKLIDKKPKESIPFSVYNIGNSKPEKLVTFLKLIEKYLGRKTSIIKRKMQLGDVYKTHASINKLNEAINYKPSKNINVGIKEFVYWYKDYFYRKKNK